MTSPLSEAPLLSGKELEVVQCILTMSHYIQKTNTTMGHSDFSVSSAVIIKQHTSTPTYNNDLINMKLKI